jgi:hypothetical protein
MVFGIIMILLNLDITDSATVHLKNKIAYRFDYAYTMNAIERRSSEYIIDGENGYFYRFIASCNVTPSSNSILLKLRNSIETVEFH